MAACVARKSITPMTYEITRSFAKLFALVTCIIRNVKCSRLDAPFEEDKYYTGLVSTVCLWKNYHKWNFLKNF